MIGIVAAKQVKLASQEMVLPLKQNLDLMQLFVEQCLLHPDELPQLQQLFLQTILKVIVLLDQQVLIELKQYKLQHQHIVLKQAIVELMLRFVQV
jgi:hypothetical protein